MRIQSLRTPLKVPHGRFPMHYCWAGRDFRRNPWDLHKWNEFLTGTSPPSNETSFRSEILTHANGLRVADSGPCGTRRVTQLAPLIGFTLVVFTGIWFPFKDSESNVRYNYNATDSCHWRTQLYMFLWALFHPLHPAENPKATNRARTATFFLSLISATFWPTFRQPDRIDPCLVGKNELGELKGFQSFFQSALNEEWCGWTLFGDSRHREPRQHLPSWPHSVQLMGYPLYGSAISSHLRRMVAEKKNLTEVNSTNSCFFHLPMSSHTPRDWPGFATHLLPTGHNTVWNFWNETLIRRFLPQKQGSKLFSSEEWFRNLVCNQTGFHKQKPPPFRSRRPCMSKQMKLLWTNRARVSRLWAVAHFAPVTASLVVGDTIFRTNWAIWKTQRVKMCWWEKASWSRRKSGCWESVKVHACKAHLPTQVGTGSQGAAKHCTSCGSHFSLSPHVWSAQTSTSLFAAIFNIFFTMCDTCTCRSTAILSWMRCLCIWCFLIFGRTDSARSGFLLSKCNTRWRTIERKNILQKHTHPHRLAVDCREGWGTAVRISRPRHIHGSCTGWPLVCTCTRDSGPCSQPFRVHSTAHTLPRARSQVLSSHTCPRNSPSLRSDRSHTLHQCCCRPHPK